MTGIIILWFGAIGVIPTGWKLCDGTGGTPDLRDNVPVGAGDTYAVGGSGGAINHNHGFTSDLHDHFFTGPLTIVGGAANSPVLLNESAIGTTNNSNGLSPYHALAYIQKS